MSREYQELNAGLWTFVTETAETTFSESHFYFLRQIGYEIINSPDLQAMAKASTIPAFVQTSSADLQPEQFQPLQIGGKELNISDEELNRFAAVCRCGNFICLAPVHSLILLVILKRRQLRGIPGPFQIGSHRC